jgi:hypothetical protein
LLHFAASGDTYASTPMLAIGRVKAVEIFPRTARFSENNPVQSNLIHSS